MNSLDWVTVVSGSVMGVSLGLTGGGGSTFAVPLLIYVLGAGVREAVGVSLAAVGATAFFGATMRWRSGQLELPTGLLFAVAGMMGAPLGTWLGGRMPDGVTLSLFALLMIVVGIRMWGNGAGSARASDACIRESSGRLQWTARCAVLLGLTGFAVGILSGIFGIGGGFIIVPALLLVGGLSMHRAVATSLAVIALICASGVASYFWGGEGIPLRLTGLFVVGGLLGMLGGTAIAGWVKGKTLQRVFAVGMWLVALYVLGDHALRG